jgi:hypothetical protein
MLKTVTGRQQWEAGDDVTDAWFAAARSATAINQGLAMANPTASIWNAVDLSRSIASPLVGFKELTTAFPDFGDLVNTAIKGDLPKSPLMDYMLGLGLGTGRVTGRVAQGMTLEDNLSGAVRGFERGSRKLARFGTEFSGQRAVQDAAELAVGSAIMQKMANVAQSNKALGKDFKDSLAQLGIDEKMWNRIATQLNTRALKSKDGKIMHPRSKKWLDKQAAVAFDNAVYRATQTILNLGDNTTLPRVFSHPLIKPVLQFRNFGMKAYEQVFLNTAQRGAKRMGVEFATQSFFGSIGYIFATAFTGTIGAAWFNDEYYQKRMTVENIALAGIGRAAWTSLMPTFADIGLALAGEKPAFANMRTSQVGADNGALALAFGNPTFDRASNVLGSLEMIRAPFDPTYDLSQRNITTAARAFLPNIPFVQSTVREFVSSLPRESQQSER